MSYSFFDFFCLIGAIGLFLYGMKVMSEGLQKAAGDSLRNILSAMTRNRFTGALTGFSITALIQSSSASTVMVVSFVNAGLMTLAQSMAVIMGANVGTTATAWIITLFGFKVDTSLFVLPAIALSIPLLFSSKSKTKSIGEFLVGFALLFMGLDMIGEYVPDLQQNPEIFAFLQHYSDMGFASVLLFLLVGLVVTAIIQSSSAAFAIVLIMCSKGWIDFHLACALVLGSNIGTTITPLLASMSGNVAAKRTAMGHLLFNVLGSAWTLILFMPYVGLILWITQSMGQGNPESLLGYVTEIRNNSPEVYSNLFSTVGADHPLYTQISAAQAEVARLQLSVSFGLSMFHTVFNLINLSVMIWLTKLYVRIVERLVPSKRNEEDEFQLKFISGGLMNASELNIAQAEKEIAVYGERVGRMIEMAQKLVHTKRDSNEFTEQFSRLEKYEEISDRMEIEIAHYLNRCSEGRLSNEGKLRIAAMLRIVSEIESIADCSLGVGKILVRKNQSSVDFNDEIYANIDIMFGYIKEAMAGMLAQLKNAEHVRDAEIAASYNKEREINNYRSQLRTGNIENINNRHYEYQAGIFYMDLISDLERLGDFIINVVETIKTQMRKAN